MKKKKVVIDERAGREINGFPEAVKEHIRAILLVLETDGRLAEPQAKKVSSFLFEIRIRLLGQWRVLYCYAVKHTIIILSGFRKKTQKTPKIQIEKAKQRLKDYI